MKKSYATKSNPPQKRQRQFLLLFCTLALGISAGCDQSEPLNAESKAPETNKEERLEELGLPLDLEPGSFVDPTAPEHPKELQQLVEQQRKQHYNNSNSVPPKLLNKLKEHAEQFPAEAGNGIISVEVKGKSDQENATQKLFEEFGVTKEKSQPHSSILQTMTGFSDVYAYTSSPYDYGSYYAETSTDRVFYQLDVYSRLYINSLYQTSIWDYQYNNTISWGSALGRWSPSSDLNCFSMDSDHYAYDPSYGTYRNYTYDASCV